MQDILLEQICSVCQNWERCRSSNLRSSALGRLRPAHFYPLSLTFFPIQDRFNTFRSREQQETNSLIGTCAHMQFGGLRLHLYTGAGPAWGTNGLTAVVINPWPPPRQPGQGTLRWDKPPEVAEVKDRTQTPEGDYLQRYGFNVAEQYQNYIKTMSFS